MTESYFGKQEWFFHGIAVKTAFLTFIFKSVHEEHMLISVISGIEFKPACVTQILYITLVFSGTTLIAAVHQMLKSPAEL